MSDWSGCNMIPSYLDLGVVRDSRLAALRRYCDFEHTKVVLGHGRRIAIPVVKVTNQICSQGIRSPLAVYDIAVGLHVEAELLVALVLALDMVGARVKMYSLSRTAPSHLRSR